MWESRSDFQGRWKRRKTWFSLLFLGPSFPQSGWFGVSSCRPPCGKQFSQQDCFGLLHPVGVLCVALGARLFFEHPQCLTSLQITTGFRQFLVRRPRRLIASIDAPLFSLGVGQHFGLTARTAEVQIVVEAVANSFGFAACDNIRRDTSNVEVGGNFSDNDPAPTFPGSQAYGVDIQRYNYASSGRIKNLSVFSSNSLQYSDFGVRLDWFVELNNYNPTGGWPYTLSTDTLVSVNPKVLPVDVTPEPPLWPPAP